MPNKFKVVACGHSGTSRGRRLQRCRTQNSMHTKQAQNTGSTKIEIDLLLLCGDGGVSGNEGGHNTSSSLNSHGQWCHIKQQQVLHLGVSLASQNSSLQHGMYALVLSAKVPLLHNNMALQVSNSTGLQHMHIAYYGSTDSIASSIADQIR